MDEALNLSEVRQRIDRLKQEYEQAQKINRYLFWVVFILFVTFPIASVISRDKNASTGLNWAANGLWLALILGIGVYNTKQYQKWARRFNEYAPAFVPRANWRDLMKLLFGQTWFLVLIGVLFILQVDFLVIWICAVMPLILRWLNNYTLRLIYRSGQKGVSLFLKFFPKSSALLNMKAVLLLHTGDFEAALDVFRQMLSSTNRPNFPTVALWLNNLGYCLTLAEQYSEAYPCFIAAIGIAPDVPNTYDSLATWYLQQKIEAERALELVEMALANVRPELKEGICIQQATGAYAAALTGRVTRAQALLQLSKESAKSQHQPSTLAEASRQLGYAYLALNQPDEAREHFAKAFELDPQGLYGKLAQRALESVTFTPLQAQAQI
jgi:pentatricopeptide repeat protein